SLTGTDEGNAEPQRFWMYFIPQPTDNGLPDVTRYGNRQELNDALKVELCDERGRNPIPLPITPTITNIDNLGAGYFQMVRSNKLIVGVSEGTQPAWREYQSSIGTLEDTIMVTVAPRELPEDIRGYQSVDAILWLKADALDPSKPGDEKRYHAIQEYVRQGGKLIICQPGQRDAAKPWGDLLPVDVENVLDRGDPAPVSS